MLEALGASLEGVVAGIGADLAEAAAAGNSGQFQVDLQALHDYYFKVYDIWTQLNQHANGLPQDPFAVACVNTGQIPGVTSAIESTVNSALGATESMRTAMESVRARLSKHLHALHDVYVAYVQSDSQGASELTQAGNGHAANIKINLPDPAAQAAALEAAIAGIAVATSGVFG